MQFLNNVKFSTSTSGDSDPIAVGAAITDTNGRHLTPAEAGAVDGTPSRWIINQGNDWEIFEGTPASSATSISRGTTEKSCISGSVGTTKLTLTGSGATVRAIVSAADIPTGDAAFKDTGTTAGTVAAGDDSRITGAIQSSLLTTRGDIIYRNATVPDRLAKGTQYQVLQAGADDPVYGAVNLAQAAAVTGTLPAGNLPSATTGASGISEFATAAEYRVGTDTARSLSVAEVWNAAAGATLALVSTTYTVDFSLFASLATPSAAMGGNRTLGAPSNGKAGQHFSFRFTATGSTRTLTLHANYKLWDNVEVGPYSVTTSQTLYVNGFVNDAGAYEVTSIGRRAT